jgi:hypothetical protein
VIIECISIFKHTMATLEGQGVRAIDNLMQNLQPFEIQIGNEVGFLWIFMALWRNSRKPTFQC